MKLEELINLLCKLDIKEISNVYIVYCDSNTIGREIDIKIN